MLTGALNMAHGQVATYSIAGMGPTQTSPTPISEVIYTGTYGAGASALMLSENHFRATNSETAYVAFIDGLPVSEGDAGQSPSLKSVGDRLFFSGTGDTRVRISYEWTFTSFISSDITPSFNEGAQTRVSSGGFLSYTLRDAAQAVVSGSNHYISFNRTDRLDGEVDNLGIWDNYVKLGGEVDPYHFAVEFDLLAGYSIDLAYQLDQTANAYAQLLNRGGTPNVGNGTAASGTSNLIVRVENIGGPSGALLGGNGFDYAASAVPEPSTYALLGGLAAFGLVLLRRRKMRV